MSEPPEEMEDDRIFFREAALFLYFMLDPEAATRFRKTFPGFDWDGDSDPKVEEETS